MAIIVPKSVAENVDFTLAPGQSLYAVVKNADGSVALTLINDQCDPAGGKTLTASLNYGGRLG
jgi:hypothetical protein